MSEKSFFVDGQTAQQLAFTEAAIDPHRSVVIQACAGAGKTYLLVERMVKALSDPACQADQLLAITFTNKAAAEIEDRLYQELRKDPHRETYLRLLQSGRKPNICTFHGWFAQILQGAPLAVRADLGLPLNYELLIDDQELLPDLTHRFYSEVLKSSDLRADVQSLFATHGRTQTLKALQDALNKRTEFELCDAQSPVESHVSTAQSLYPEFAAALGANTDAAWGQCVLESAVDIAFVASALAKESAKTWVDLAQALVAASDGCSLGQFQQALFTGKGERRVFRGKVDEALRTQIEHLQACLERIEAARHQDQCWRYQQSMSRITRVWLRCYAALKRARGLVDMQDLERAAWQLLSDPVIGAQVQERLDWRVRHVLIDEFQDTNALQWHAVHSWLSSYAGAGGWGQQPSVFVVGDTKQSIYRFRRAEPRVFAAARDFLVEAFGASVLQTNHTWRNARAVVDCVNRSMQAVQTTGDYTGFVPHTTEHFEVQGQIVTLPQAKRESQSDEDLTEAEQVANWILDYQQTRPEKTVMVLASKHKPLNDLQQALLAHGVFAAKQEKDYLVSHPVVQDMVALISALLIPSNHLDLVRVLKSPLFGLDDQVLIALKLSSKDESLNWLDRLALVAKNDTQTQLKRWQMWLSTLPPFDALQRIYVDGQVLEKYHACVPQQMRASSHAALQALLDMALQTDGGRFLDAMTFLKALKNPVQSVKLPALTDAAAQISLCTIHAAKGLEADAVVVLDMDAAAPPKATMMSLIDWEPANEHPNRFVFIEREAAPPQDAQALLDVEHGLEATEEVNRLYVALTRAKEVLVLSSTEPHRKNDKSMWVRASPPVTA